MKIKGLKMGRKKLPAAKKRRDIKIYLTEDELNYAKSIMHNFISSRGHTTVSAVFRGLLLRHRRANERPKTNESRG